MYYSVQVKRHPFAIDVEYTFEDAYFQGCDKHYMTKDEAEEYLVSFEDWEQKMLVIEEFPFWVPGVMPGDRIPHSVLPPAEMGTALPLLETWIAIMQYLQLIAEIV